MMVRDDRDVGLPGLIPLPSTVQTGPNVLHAAILEARNSIELRLV